MSTRTLATATGIALVASVLCWAILEEGRSFTPEAAPAVAPAPSEATTQLPEPGSGRASALPEDPRPHRLARVRHVTAMPPVTCDEFWVRVQPIFNALPHMTKDDIHKLDYFCPADFNKDDRIDVQDIALFRSTWSDEASPLFNWCDLTGDGVVDEIDAIEFMREYREGAHNCEELRELRSTIC